MNDFRNDTKDHYTKHSREFSHVVITSLLGHAGKETVEKRGKKLEKKVSALSRSPSKNRYVKP